MKKNKEAQSKPPESSDVDLQRTLNDPAVRKFWFWDCNSYRELADTIEANPTFKIISKVYPSQEIDFRSLPKGAPTCFPVCGITELIDLDKLEDPKGLYVRVKKRFQELYKQTPVSMALSFPEKSCDGLEYIVMTCRACEAALASGKVEKTENQKPAETEQNAEGSKIMVTARTSKENWEAIRGEYGVSKVDFAKKIKFVKDRFKKNVIFRDVEHASVLASQGYSKPALILAGGVIEELLRLYLKRKRIKPKDGTFFAYIQTCENNRLLKRGVYRLSDSIRDFRNLVHLKNETIKKHTVSKATAKGAVSSIFTIANDFQ